MGFMVLYCFCYDKMSTSRRLFLCFRFILMGHNTLKKPVTKKVPKLPSFQIVVCQQQPFYGYILRSTDLCYVVAVQYFNQVRSISENRSDGHRKTPETGLPRYHGIYANYWHQGSGSSTPTLEIQHVRIHKKAIIIGHPKAEHRFGKD